MSFYDQHQSILQTAIKANQNREYFAQYPENPKAYGEQAQAKGLADFQQMMNTDFSELLQTNPLRFEGEEVSPYLQLGLGIRYPVFADKILIKNALQTAPQWAQTTINERAGILIECLEQIKNRFFDIAYATMHTTGQSFVMSFQASGPHANDRALEAIAMAYTELTRFPQTATWEKPMGKSNITLHKTWSPIPKGIGLVIGCSTFPTWNSLTSIFANLMAGNSVIVKPHPKAILPIAIVVAEMQNVLSQINLDPNTIQLAADTSAHPLTKDLATDPNIKLIDYTGNSQFGTWLETLQSNQKTIFTEKAGINAVIIDSTDNLKAMCDNLAFSVSLYSGQMCTAPQNFFIPADGIHTEQGHKTFDELCQTLAQSIDAIANNPKMGANVLGCIQNQHTHNRIGEAQKTDAKILLASQDIENSDFKDALTASIAVLQIDADQTALYEKEWFGPIVLLIKTKDTKQSITLAQQTALKHGAISCACYTTNPETQKEVAKIMNNAFTPVSFNLIGGVFVNQHAAFSDFHVTGGNPAGNASFTNPDYINRRFVWVGNRTL